MAKVIAFINDHVRVVQVMRGWTFLVKDFGSLAPNTNVARVANSMDRVWRGVVAALGRLDRNARMDATEEIAAPAVRP